jgi:[protein-PII] uridylyltransferase
VKAERQALLDDTDVVGRAWCEAYSQLVDDWLQRVLTKAAGSPAVRGLALVAVGGYGRRELAPSSDIDLWLVHTGRSDVGELAERIWYPIWDEGLKLGHAVRSLSDTLVLVADDLETATSVLTARHVAGDPDVTAELAAKGRASWQKKSKRWLAELATSSSDRHRRAGEVAFLLEPDLKDGRGGLRDAHSIWWARDAGASLHDVDDAELQTSYSTLLSVRIELHRRTGRPSDVLLLQEQDAVAESLRYADADALMHAVSSAARTISWTCDETWRHVAATSGGAVRRALLSRRTDNGKPLAEWLVLRDGEVHVADGADVGSDPVLPLRAAALAAAHITTIDRRSLERLAASSPPLPSPWPPEARQRLVQLLLAGPACIRVIEALDQRGLWTKVLPEWAPTRSKPQRNAYHRFTVDRHLVEAAAGAAALAGRVRRPDLLVVGTLLHDIGKGRPGDHTIAGMDLVREMAARMGFPAADVDTLVALVQHHLLLPDVATRRDLDDPGTIELVAKAVGDEGTLELLAALTEADSIATGPAAWGSWKAGLVADLVDRTAHVLRGGAFSEVRGDDFPSASHLATMASGEQVLDGRDDTLTVITADRPGVFAKVAGVLALHGLDVLEAAAYSSDDGQALARFRVEPSFGPVVPWDRVTADLQLVFAGRLALTARLDERARTYSGRRPPAAAPVRAGVSVDNRASATATVIDVQAPDSVGLLHRITRALAELELDIRSAKVSTIGPQAVDAFYVRGADGGKVHDAEFLAEVERAVLHAIDTAPD